MATAAPLPGDIVPASPRAANILIVDDRPENLLALEAALSPLEQNLLEADSGEEALRVLLKQDVAVIILDVQMPGLDGFETARYIKQLERTKHIPIIFLTAINKEARHVFRGYEEGAVDYLFKPYDPVVLRSKVSVFIDLYRKTNELQTSEERFRRTFEHAPIGVALVAPSGTLLKVNRALETITGMSQAELVSKTIHDLIRSGDSPLKLDDLTREAGLGHSAWQGEYRLATSGGVDRYAVVSASFIGSPDGSDPHFIFQITDITERRELEEFRERFVSHAAHELRTPATVIAGTASLLHDSRGSMSEPELDKCITALYRQAQRLTAMVGNLLDLARLKEGRADTTIEPVDLADAVTSMLEATPPPAGLNIVVDIRPGTKALTDADALDHVLSNLFINAYRYGGPNLTIGAEPNGRDVLVTIADDGEGVPAELVPRMFEPFTRGRKSSSVGGSGLGLALVKSLVETSGGRIRYEGGPDGAVFEIRFPVAS